MEFSIIFFIFLNEGFPYQDGNLVVMIDPSQIFLFNLDSFPVEGKENLKKGILRLLMLMALC